jgi:hypothetical protein
MFGEGEKRVLPVSLPGDFSLEKDGAEGGGAAWLPCKR